MRSRILVALAVSTTMVALMLGGTGAAEPSPDVSDAPGDAVPHVDQGAPAPAGPKLKSCPSDGSVNFDSYSAGAAVAGIKLSRSSRSCEPLYTGPTAPPVRINNETKIYGSCTPAPATESCGFPLTVESWPACERNLSLYKRYPAPDGSTVAYVTTKIRGVPAAVFENGTRIEVYTGDATVVITAQDADLARRASRQLVGKHGGKPVTEDEDLPDAQPGALGGAATC